MEFDVKRRYCKICKNQQTPTIPRVLPNEHFDNNTMSLVAIMRCLGISFGKIQTLFDVTHDEFIHTSVLDHICEKVAYKLRPLYENLRDNLQYRSIINGDETVWFYNGSHYWVFGYLYQKKKR